MTQPNFQARWIRRYVVAGLAVLTCLTIYGCDWSQFGLLNAIPIEGTVKTAHVFLAVDGLSPALIERGRVRGDLPGIERFKQSRLIAMFPASSDVSWTRTLWTHPLKGYEMHYYNPEKDELENNGYAGLIAHGLPDVDGVVEGPEYLEAFDYHADGYFDVLQSYVSLDAAYSETLDGLFSVLGGRSETNDTFFGYVADIDISGHMRSDEETEYALAALWRRIAQFRAEHPDRRFIFTLFSDHGFDDIPAGHGDFVDFPKEMKRYGVEPVDMLSAARGRYPLYAVPIVHTPITYMSLHTDPSIASEVAKQCSMSPTAYVVLSIASPDPSLTASVIPDLRDPDRLQWFEIWQDGQRLVWAAHDPATDRYYLKEGANLVAVGLERLEYTVEGSFLVATDEALFEASVDSPLPDLLYRTSTALSTYTVEYPAQVLVSFKRPYTSLGFRTFSKVEDQARHSFHGGIDAGSSTGVLLSEEDADLPPHVRSEEILNLFPRLVEHIEKRGLKLKRPRQIELLTRSTDHPM